MTFVPIRKPFVSVKILGNMYEQQRPIRFCIHSTETHDIPGSAKDVAAVLAYLKSTDIPGDGHEGLGVQFCIDAEGYLGQGGWPGRRMNGALGANEGTIHCELVGQARFLRLRWRMRKRQLEKLSRLMAYCHHRYNIPLVWDVNHGFFTHKMATDAFEHGIGHWDPGPGFPTGQVMFRAIEIVKHGGWEQE